jgi:hypothetical protein
MSDWQSMSRAAARSARFLQESKGHQDPRGSINRSYYAVYCAIAHSLPTGLNYPHGRKNPPHERIPKLVRDHLLAGNPDRRREVEKAFNFLKEARVTADYRPLQTADRQLCALCLKRSHLVLKALEVIR